MRHTTLGNNTQETYRIARCLTGKHSDPAKPAREADGCLLTAEAEQSEKWSTYFEDLLNKPSVAVAQSLIESARRNNFVVTAPTLSEIKCAAATSDFE